MTTLGKLLREIDATPEGAATAAFFDLDGTLVSGYTAGAFYRHRLRHGQVGLGEFARSMAVFADSKLGGNPGRLGPIAVEGLRGQSRAELESLGEELFEGHIARDIRPEIRELLEAHQRRGHTVAIASSATHFQADPVAHELGVEHVLCSEVTVEDGELTGRFENGMLWDEAKAAAVRSFARESGVDLAGAFAYANGDEDIPLLASVGNPHAVAPDPMLKRVAKMEGWPVLHLPDERGAGARAVIGTAAAAAGINASLGLSAIAGLVKRDRRAGANLAGRFAFDVALGLAGVRVRVIGEENLWSARPAVFVFNHQSNLDPIVAGALIRRDFTSTGKKEARRDPMAALAGYVLDAVFLDREDPQRAKQQIGEAVERLRGGVSVMIAPEGTRSRTSIPGPYKHGAFHVAMEAGVPIVPIVLRNSGELMPRGSTWILPGTLDVRVLEPIPTAGWSTEDVAREAETLQRRTADLVAGIEEVGARPMSSDPREVNREAWESVASWSSSPRMNDMEAVMWRAERHPSLSSTIIALELLDTAPGWDRLRDAHEWGSRLVKRFRQRVVDPFPHVRAPEFEEDPDFDLDCHLRREQIGPDAPLDEAVELAEAVALAPLDRDHPLWEAVLVEGLEGGRSAYILKSHHSLSDGIAGIQLFGGIHSRTREPSPDKPVADDVSDDDGDRSGGRLDLAARLPRAAAHAAPAAVRAAVHPRTAIRGGMRLTGSLRRVLDADVGPPSPLFADRSGESWRFQVLDCPLDDLRAAAKASGAKLNDAYIAALLGGLRIYHERAGVEIETLPIAIPVSVRDPGDELGGNRFTAIQVKGPIGIRDPRERIAVIHGTVLAARAEPALNMTGMLAPVMSRLPSALVLAARTRVGAGADVAASNFPGISWEAFVAGARVERTYAFGPLPGAALMSTLVSHNGVCCIGLNCDGSVITDPKLLRDCVREGLDEVLAIGRAGRPDTRRDSGAAAH